jgi:hypothetical protein
VPHALDRTHLGKHDLDWLPPQYRAIRWTVAGSVWTGIFGSVAALSVFSHVNAIVFGKGLAVLAASGYVAGDRVARTVLRGRLRKLAHGAVDLSRLPSEPDGELVHVVGRVRALKPVGGIVKPEARAVYRRVVFSIDTTRVVHEAAEDFWLVSGNGEPVLVEAAEARLLAPDGDGAWFESGSPVLETLEALPLPSQLDAVMARRHQRRDKGKKVGRTRVAETLLCDGDEIEVLGYKSRTVDVMVASRLERDTPYRATLRAGQRFPLLLAPRAT